MPKTEILLYREGDGSVPVVAWLLELQARNRAAFEKCLFLLDLLEEHGSELRRPRADYLRDGVYELRTEVRNVNYRLLYGFVGKDVAVVSHGFTKQRQVPSKEIELAIERLDRFKENPDTHRATREENDEQKGY
jgi:phage-related protein